MPPQSEALAHRRAAPANDPPRFLRDLRHGGTHSLLQSTILDLLLRCNFQDGLHELRHRDTRNLVNVVLYGPRHRDVHDLLPFAHKLRQRDGLIDDRLHNALLDHFEDFCNLLQEGRQPDEQRSGRQRKRGTSTALPVLIVQKPTTFASMVRTRVSSPTPSHVSWATHVALNQTHSRCESHWLKPGHEWPRLEPKWLEPNGLTDLSEFFFVDFRRKNVCFVSRPMKIATFLRKNDYLPKRVVDFLRKRDTFRSKIMEIVEDFACEPNFFIFLSFSIIFLHFFVFSICFHSSIFIFSFFHLLQKFFSFFFIFHFLTFFSILFLFDIFLFSICSFFQFFQFFIFFHFLFLFFFFIFHHFLSFLCLLSFFLFGLNFVTISLDSSYVKKSIFVPSQVVKTPFGPSFPFVHTFFSGGENFNSCLGKYV